MWLTLGGAPNVAHTGRAAIPLQEGCNTSAGGQCCRDPSGAIK